MPPMFAASIGKMNKYSHLILLGEISSPPNRWKKKKTTQTKEKKECVHCHGAGEPIKTFKS